MASSSRNEPTTRSRTLLFLSYRDSAARSTPGAKRRDPLGKGKARASYDENEESIALLGREEDVRLDVEEEGAGLPPAWADASDQVDEVLLRVKPKSVCSYHFYPSCVGARWTCSVPVEVLLDLLLLRHLTGRSANAVLSRSQSLRWTGCTQSTSCRASPTEQPKNERSKLSPPTSLACVGSRLSTKRRL